MTAPSETTNQAIPQQVLANRFDWAHRLFILALVLWRPFIATADLSSTDHIMWHGILAGAIACCCFEAFMGLRKQWYWSITGLIASGLLLIFMPAVLQSPKPSSAWGLWSSWLGQLCFAAYLLQVIPGRTRWVWCCLSGSIAIHFMLALGQYYFVLPSLASMQASGSINLPGLADHMQDDLRDRIANGGIYSTFTIANAFAMIIVAASLCYLGQAWQLRGHKYLIIPLLLIATCLISWWLTGAKGAVAAALVAAPLVVLCSPGAGRWRLLAGLALVGICLAPFIYLPSGLELSAQVRAGYWIAGWQLWLESPFWGHGLGAYELMNGTHLPYWAEFSRHEHNEYLAALVAAGPLALIGLVLWAVGVCWTATTAAGKPATTTSVAEPITKPFTVLFAVPCLCYAAILGTFVSDNLDFWPHGQSILGRLAWVSGMALVASAVMLAVYRIGSPTWPWRRWALMAIMLGCAIDFHLHDASFIAIIICIATLPSSRWFTANKLRNGLIVGIAALLFCFFMVAQQRANSLNRAQTLLTVLDGVRDDDANRANDYWLSLAWLMNSTVPETGQARERLYRLASAEAFEASLHFPVSTDIAVHSAIAGPDAQTTITRLQHLETAGFRDGRMEAIFAQAFAAQRDLATAIGWQQQLVARSPWHLPARQQLERLFNQAAQRSSGEQRRRYEQQAAEQKAFIETWKDKVWARNRPRSH